MTFEPPCQHKVGRFCCCSIPVNSLYKTKRVVLAKPDRKEQDKRLSFLLNVSSPKRRRVRNDPKNKPTALTVQYHVSKIIVKFMIYYDDKTC